jgi:hypothetical protein
VVSSQKWSCRRPYFKHPSKNNSIPRQNSDGGLARVEVTALPTLLDEALAFVRVWQNRAMATERIEVQRAIKAPPDVIFRLLCDPQGHVSIDSSGMLQSATGEPVQGVGDSFVVHMDREALNDYPLGLYDVTVTITSFVRDHEISWTILGTVRPGIGHVYGYRLEPADGATVVTSFYDWSNVSDEWKASGVFPVISEGALRATLGILDRTIRSD